MKANILIIDDELTVCKSCQKILGDEYNVSIVLNGREGLERARNEAFDLLVVDLKMPDLDGMEIVRVIKKERPAIPVIIMTGYSTVHSAVEGMRLGAADYIPKPFTPDEMSVAVRKALRQEKNKARTDIGALLINRDAIIEVLTRASEDIDFAAGVSDPGSDALKDYDLSPEEKAALVSVIHPSEEESMLIVSHELRDPLASIASLARAIQKPNIAGDRKKKFLNKIIARAESGLTMVEEYLALSAINAGELKIAPKKVKPYEEVIERTLDDQREAMVEKLMTVDIDVPRELEIVCDPKYMKIVYNNLISNAIKYGTANSEIEIGYSGARNGHHYFNVANVGEWIKEDDRKRIFEKHVTLGKENIGIGLHVSREIVKRHGGNIWVESCYCTRGKCIAKKSIIKKTDDELMPGNSFIFTIRV